MTTTDFNSFNFSNYHYYVNLGKSTEIFSDSNMLKLMRQTGAFFIRFKSESNREILCNVSDYQNQTFPVKKLKTGLYYANYNQKRVFYTRAQYRVYLNLQPFMP